MLTWDSYSFTRPLTSDGKPTRYLSVLSLLNEDGPTNRHEILKSIWHIISLYQDKVKRKIRSRKTKDRGRATAVFVQYSVIPR